MSTTEKILGLAILFGLYLWGGKIWEPMREVWLRDKQRLPRWKFWLKYGLIVAVVIIILNASGPRQPVRINFDRPFGSSF